MLTSDRLTSNLVFEIERANVALSRWAERKNDWLDSTESNYKQNVEEFTCTIQALKENEEQLENIREHQEMVKNQQTKELEEYSTKLKSLLGQKQDLFQALQVSQLEEEKEKKRLQTALEELTLVQKKTSRKVDEISYGVQQYGVLGLEFVRCEGECMRFVFTQIDARLPARQFYFTMFVDANDRYNLVDTYPVLDRQLALTLVNDLNEDNNISKFVVRMRSAFKKLSTRAF